MICQNKRMITTTISEKTLVKVKRGDLNRNRQWLKIKMFQWMCLIKFALIFRVKLARLSNGTGHMTNN